MAIRIFVSYAREDEAAKDELLAALGPLEGVEIWHDRKLIAGARFGDEIRRQIRSAHIVLLLISRHFNASTWCRDEKDEARARPRARVIPVILDDAEWSELREELSAAPTDGKPVAEWQDREEAMRDAARLIREALPRHGGIAANLPLRNRNFQGREDLLERLRDAIAAPGGAILHALAGMGGVGKTELAIEYAHRHPDDHSFICWLRGGGAAEFAALADVFGLPERTNADQNLIVEAVKRELAASENWLLIFDNVETPQDIASFVPNTSSGRILVTTRYQAWGAVGKAIDVDVMKRGDAITLLVSRSGAGDPAGANELADELGDLPLALEQAAAYIEQNAKTFDGYVRLFRTHHRKELSSVVATTLNLSFDGIQSKNPVAADLLKLYAFVAPGDIPRTLLSDTAVAVPEELRVLAADELLMDKAIRTLLDYSAVRAEKNSVGFHPLSQLVIRDRLPADQTAYWTRAACAVVNEAFPMQPQDSREWPHAARMLPHVRAACEAAERAGADNDDAAPLLNRAAMYLRHRGELDAAADVYSRAEAWLLRFRGPDDPALPTIRTNLAIARGEVGDHADAIEVFRRKLEHDRRTHGDLHPLIAVDLSNLGDALVVAGRPAEALPLLRESEALLEQLGIEEHAAAYATTRANVANALVHLGDQKTARRELEAALAIKERIYGPGNAKLVRTLYNLGRVLVALGDVSGSGEQFTRALTMAEEQLGANSPDTLLLRLELAVHTARTGDVAAAVPAFQKALSEVIQRFGPASFSLHITTGEFAAAIESQGYPDLASRFKDVETQLIALRS
jgi:tetratricopeptide (TPR) repeat protein